MAASIGKSRPIGNRHRLQTPVHRRTEARAGGGAAPSSGNGGVLVLPGFLFSSGQYSQLVADLRDKGFHAGARQLGGLLAGSAVPALFC
jgi:alpha-beta hydrolase superfamily lysophospholipase